MKSTHKPVFELIKHHGDDYIEFNVSYYLDYNLWTAHGMGWVSNDTPAYYLNSLKLNKFLAGSHYNEKANIHLQDLSLKFQNTDIENFTLFNIRKHFSRTRTRLKHMPA